MILICVQYMKSRRPIVDILIIAVTNKNFLCDGKRIKSLEGKEASASLKVHLNVL